MLCGKAGQIVIGDVDAEHAQLKWSVLAPIKFAVLLFCEKFNGVN
jgi:hypothetical protein